MPPATAQTILLLDIGNTHTHAGWATCRRIRRQFTFPTGLWSGPGAKRLLRNRLGRHPIRAVAFCSVVPQATVQVRCWTRQILGADPFELTSKTTRGLGIDYPNPKTIGPDRLANAIAAKHRYGTPVVVVDFGTAVTFDVVNRRGDYVGGIIAPGLSAMTDYLHEKTALLPAIKIREPGAAVGKNTVEAMRIGAVHGYRGLVRSLILELKKELRTRRLSVIATGGCARLIAAKLPEIAEVAPSLTLDGLRLAYCLASRESMLEKPK